jgi:hypothetical protein
VVEVFDREIAEDADVFFEAQAFEERVEVELGVGFAAKDHAYVGVETGEPAECSQGFGDALVGF